MSDDRLVTEVPSSLKQLARLVVRGFYTIEDALIVDMLVRNPCMKEDDLCELLKFDRKMLRARISLLKNDKFLQVRLKMETGIDGKAQKVNYYFINYKTFVNVVKYKLDLMRKRMETEERYATSRASFKCPGCAKTFTDLEADQIFDFTTGEFHCTYCREKLEEDQSAMPKKDSRLLLAKFNEQLEPLYVLLKEVEGIKLAPEVLEPEPVDISTIRGTFDSKKQQLGLKPSGEQWSGEATRSHGFTVEETKVDITIGDDLSQNNDAVRKERPIWMLESTVMSQHATPDAISSQSTDAMLESVAQAASGSNAAVGANSSNKSDDIMSVLLAHEKKGTNAVANALRTVAEDSDSSSDDMNEINSAAKAVDNTIEEIDVMDSDEDDNTPTVTVGNRTVPITEVDNDLIAEMTPSEKEVYIQVYQEYYSPMFD